MVELKNSTFGSVGATAAPQEKTKTPFDLKSLIETGIIKKDIEIDGQKFVIKSLSMSERKHLTALVSKMVRNDTAQDLEQSLELNNIMLSFVVESVNGIPLENLHPEPILEPHQRKLEIIEQMQFHVLIDLLNFYNDEVLAPTEKNIDVGEVKN